MKLKKLINNGDLIKFHLVPAQISIVEQIIINKVKKKAMKLKPKEKKRGEIKGLNFGFIDLQTLLVK